MKSTVFLFALWAWLQHLATVAIALQQGAHTQAAAPWAINAFIAQHAWLGERDCELVIM